MQDVKLSDQLGAMAIIDELYQKQQLLLEHLDREGLRANLKENIKTFYEAKGQIVDDKIVDEGIDLWFDNRLRFVAPKRPWFQHFLVRCYIKRKLIFSLFSIFLFILASIFFNNLTYTRNVRQKIDSYYSQILASEDSLTELRNEFKQIDKTTVHYAQIPVKNLKTSISNLLSHKIIPTVTKPTINGAFITDDENGLVKQFKQINDSVTTKLSDIKTQLNILKKLLEDDKRLANLIDDDEFIKTSKEYHVLQNAVDTVLDNLNQGQRVIDFNQIETLYNSTERAKNIINKIQIDNQKLLALKVPKSDMVPVIALQSDLQADLKNLNFDKFENYQQMMSYYFNLAQTNLTLTIVDKPNYKSGVERTHEKTNGKSWYVIVTPTTSSGIATPLWVTSIETGETKLVDMFGQQVSQKEFNKVKKDKIADGHIDENKLCKKPIGRLEFNCPNTVKTGRILEW